MSQVTVVMTCSAPTGFLVEHGSWRWTFWVAIPIGVVALLVTEWALRFSFPCRRRAIDWLGALFIVASVSALLLVLSLEARSSPGTPPKPTVCW
jgi:hypothetical protein